MVDGKRVDGMILTLISENDPRVGYLLDGGFPFVLYGRLEKTALMFLWTWTGARYSAGPVSTSWNWATAE